MFDIIIISIIFFSTMAGLIQGFIKTILNMIFFVLSFVIIIILYPVIKSYILQNFGAIGFINPIIFAASSIISYFIIFILKSFVFQITSIFSGSFLDKILGASFGFARGMICSLIIFISCVIFSSDSDVKNTESTYEYYKELIKSSKLDWLKKSKTYEMLNFTSGVTLNFIPNHELKLETYTKILFNK
jgi:membrane protein required for colicin V production